MAVVGEQPSQTASLGRRRRHITTWREAFSLATEVLMFDDPRWNDSRDRADAARDLGRCGRDPLDVRDREQVDPRDVFTSDLDLPRGHEREPVWERDRHYSLRASESR